MGPIGVNRKLLQMSHIETLVHFFFLTMTHYVGGYIGN